MKKLLGALALLGLLAMPLAAGLTRGRRRKRKKKSPASG